MAESIEDSSISELEKVRRGLIGDGIDSSGPDRGRGANRGKTGRNARMLRGEDSGNPAAMEGLCPRFRDYRRRMVQGGIKQTMKTADGSENRQPRDSGRQSGGIAGARRR